jgi:mRNA-degrading endonuclease RelE of RelBE toxin-antitoxin system
MTKQYHYSGSIDKYAIGVYHNSMEFIETPTFTRLITSLLPDDEYRLLQTELVENPEKGALIKNGGGIRKVRFAAQSKGKSGGIRVIYYWLKDERYIHFWCMTWKR